jgi:hypothetical protein
VCQKQALKERRKSTSWPIELNLPRPAASGAILERTTATIRPAAAPLQTLALAAAQWMAVFAASCMDGHAVAVEHWKGEIVENAD